MRCTFYLLALQNMVTITSTQVRQACSNRRISHCTATSRDRTHCRMNLDTLERRRQHHMVKTFHKVFYGHDGINIPASIIPSQRDNLKFVQPASRINCHLYRFYPRAIRFWNLLPFHLRNMNDMDAFGQSLTAAVVEKMSSQSHAQVRRL